MVKFGRLVTADPHGTAILATLCAIADVLDRDGAPVNYEHRRELAGQIELLDSETRIGSVVSGSGPGSWSSAMPSVGGDQVSGSFWHPWVLRDACVRGSGGARA